MKITPKGRIVSAVVVAIAFTVSLQLLTGNTDVVFAQTCAPPPSGLVSWWSGDGNANDIVGANPGILQNGATLATGKVGQAFSFNGANQFVSLPDNAIPYPQAGTSNTPFSFGAWFKTTAGGVILGQQDVDPLGSPSGWVPGVYVGTDGRLRVQMFWKGTTDPVASSGPVNDGLFHYVAVTYDGAIQSVYLDGMFIGSKPLTQVAYASVYKYQVGTGFTGFWPGAPNGWYSFNGLIDEVEFYNRALTASEIQATFVAGNAGHCKPDADGDGVTDANDACPGTPAGTAVNIAGCPVGQCLAPPDGLVSWWPGDGNGNDIIGKNPGTLQGGVTFAPGKVGQAFSFRGSNQSIVVADAPTLDISTAVTIDAWINPASLSCPYGFCAVLAKSDYLANTRNYGLWVRSDGGLHLSYITNSGTNILLDAPAGLISPGVFSHVAGVINPPGKVMQIYVNGALVASRSTTAMLIPNNLPLTIGFSDPGTNLSFNGLIDEIGIYNRALTFAEIAGIFAADSLGKCKQLWTVQPPQISCNAVTVSTDAGVCFTTLQIVWDNTTNPKVVTTNGTILATISDANASNTSVTFSPTQVPKGTNSPISITANYGLGDTASKTCAITVIDTTPPMLQVPPDVTVECTSPNGQVVNIGRAIATDACDPNPIVTNDAPALFWLGRTTVDWKATDASGNVATGMQSVTVGDTTAPQVTASLSPAGHVNPKGGRFRVGFSATDTCDLAPEVKAVMEIPKGTEKFKVVFQGQDDDKNEAKIKDRNKHRTEIKIDMKHRRIELKGANKADLKALLARMQKEGGAPVSNGQLLRLRSGQAETFKFIFVNGVLQKVIGPRLSLKVTAKDRSGNVGVATATPVFKGK